MKKIVCSIAMSMLLITLSACSTKTENNIEVNIAESPVTENRFLNYDFRAVSSPVKLNETAVPVKHDLPLGYQHSEYYGTSEY